MEKIEMHLLTGSDARLVGYLHQTLDEMENIGRNVPVWSCFQVEVMSFCPSGKQIQ